MLAFKKYDTANADDEQSRKASILSSLRRLELEFRMSSEDILDCESQDWE